MNLEVLERYYKEGWLIRQTHPTFPLTIWNYSQATQYERKWDEITLQCRGLVTDEKGNIVARPFKKFFNIEEREHTPTSEFEVYEKMDGSLGILFNYNQEWVFASRGSFNSDQCIKFKEIFYKNHDELLLSRSNTYLFEIIYPENRIVVDYGDEEKIVMLGEIHTDSGEELDLEFNIQLGFNIAKKYDGIEDYTQLKSKIQNNQEGFVIKFSNGDRCKIKGEEYLRLHKIMTEISTKSIWECLSTGGDIYKLLENVPDEFFNKIDEYVEELNSQYILLESKASVIFERLKKHTSDRATFAKYAKITSLASILFKMLDGKSYRDVIWNMIKPEYKKL
jgi:RNA ligase